MSINKLSISHGAVFGFEITGKLSANDFEAFLPEIEKAIAASKKPLRMLLKTDEMHGADVKSEWEAFSFLRKHVADLELIAIVGVHPWEKTMSEILASTIFVEAETRYFSSDEFEDAHKWLQTAAHPKHIPVRKVISSDKGIFTKYSSPNYI